MTKEKKIVSIRKILGQNREDQSNLGTFSMAMKNAFSFYTSSELSFVHLHFVCGKVHNLCLHIIGNYFRISVLQ